MKYRRYFFYGVLLIWSLSACSEEGDDENVIVSKESVRSAFDKRLTVSSNTTVIEYEGGSLTFTVTSNLEWTVSVPTWCSCSVSSGKDNGVFNVTVTENTNLSSRSGVITVTATGVDSRSITITQNGNPYSDLPSSGDNIPPA